MGAPRVLLLPALCVYSCGSKQRVRERSPCPCAACWLPAAPLEPAAAAKLLSTAVQPARPAGTALSLGLRRKGSFPCSSARWCSPAEASPGSPGALCSTQQWGDRCLCSRR